MHNETFNLSKSPFKASTKLVCVTFGMVYGSHQSTHLNSLFISNRKRTAKSGQPMHHSIIIVTNRYHAPSVIYTASKAHSCNILCGSCYCLCFSFSFPLLDLAFESTMVTKHFFLVQKRNDHYQKLSILFEKSRMYSLHRFPICALLFRFIDINQFCCESEFQCN